MLMERFRFSFLVEHWCFMEIVAPSLIRAIFVRVVLLRSSRGLLCERLVVLDGDCESETGPRVEDAFDLASGATDRGLRASDLMIGASSRLKDTSSCVRRSARSAITWRLPVLQCQARLSPISRSSACPDLRRSNLKYVASTRPPFLFPSGGEVDVHDSHRQDADQQHVCFKDFFFWCVKWEGTDGVFCCPRYFHFEI